MYNKLIFKVLHFNLKKIQNKVEKSGKKWKKIA